MALREVLTLRPAIASITAMSDMTTAFLDKDHCWHLRAAMERARVETALRESEERFRQFADASTDVLWIRNAQTMAIEYLNPAFERVYGYPREEILGEGPGRWGELIHPEDRAAALSALERGRTGARVTHEFRLPLSDGGMRWIEDTDFPLFDPLGKVQRIGGFGKDVTEKKETAERMKVLVAELQHRHRQLN
jgi:PAS domain S-box-containing protein